MTAVELVDATLGFPGRCVLHGVSLTVAAGAFVGVLGPNGAGKTTLLRAILGLVTPQSGTVRVLGRPAVRGHAQIGYLPQAHSAAGLNLAGRDVLLAGLWDGRWRFAWPDREAQRDVDRALDLVDAGALARRPMRTLSGGERQRLLLAQALLGRPSLLLLDEPLLSLDPRHQQAVVALVRRLQQELGLTVLFSAHDLNPLLGAIDQVLYLAAGRAAVGAVDDVVTGPTLSRLYGAEVDVVRAAGRIFVVPGATCMALQGAARVRV